jgi:hypothetical protein
MAIIAKAPIKAETITVRVPLAFRRRGGRKIISHPAGLTSPITRAPRQSNSPIVRALAKAFRWRKLIESGVYATIQEVADAGKVNPSYVGRVMRLTLLAPDIVEAILDGTHDPALTLDALLKPFPIEWKAQIVSLDSVRR